MLRTEKQRRELCTACPVAKVADIVGDACSLLILRDLLEGPKRFGDISQSLGMSTRTITKTLQRLVESGFIARKELRGLPPHVEYSLTKKGAALRGLIEEMRKYGKRYL